MPCLLPPRLNFDRCVKTKENAVIGCLFYSSLVLSIRYSVYGKKGSNGDAIKEFTSKGRDVYPSGRQTLL